MQFYRKIFPGFPIEIIGEVLSFLSLESTRIAESNFCYRKIWEFYERKPKTMFREMVWRHRLKRKHAGTRMYALNVLEKEFGHVQSGFIHCETNPTREGLQNIVFRRWFVVPGHGSCETCMRNLVEGDWHCISKVDRVFFENHFFEYFMPIASSMMKETTRKTWQIHGFGNVFSLLVLGVFGFDKMDEKLKHDTLALFLKNHKLCDRVFICYPGQGIATFRYIMQNNKLKAMGIKLSHKLQSLPRIHPAMKRYLEQIECAQSDAESVQSP